jgi:hypothetical protein
MRLQRAHAVAYWRLLGNIFVDRDLGQIDDSLGGRTARRESVATKPVGKRLLCFLLIAAAVAMTGATAPVMADNFGSVLYDANGDRLILTMNYDGTQPNHHFSVLWGSCLKLDQPGAPAHQIALDILDEQGNDAAEKPYKKVVRVPLVHLACRPARVTLSTSPSAAWNRETLDIP